MQETIHIICRCCREEYDLPVDSIWPMCENCNSLVCRECLEPNGLHCRLCQPVVAVPPPETPRWIDLPVTRACVEKWNVGRAKRGAEFVGDPLEELYGELIDGINYGDQAQIEGEDLSLIVADLIDMAKEVREKYLTRQAKMVNPDARQQTNGSPAAHRQTASVRM